MKYELHHKDGYKIIAELKNGKWYDMQGYELKNDCWVWCSRI